MTYSENDVKKAVEAAREFIKYNPTLRWQDLSAEDFYQLLVAFVGMRGTK